MLGLELEPLSPATPLLEDLAEVGRGSLHNPGPENLNCKQQS